VSLKLGDRVARGQFSPNPHKEEALQALREGVSIEEVVRRWGISDKTARRYQKEAKEGPKPPKPQSTKVGGITPLGTVVIPQTGVAVFTVGQDQVQIYPEDLFKCYDEYRDMRDLIDWQGDFSSTIREGAKMYRAVMCKLLGGNKNE
jgi:hypothetical protein